MSRNTAAPSGGATEPNPSADSKEQRKGVLAKALAVLKAAKAKLKKGPPKPLELDP